MTGLEAFEGDEVEITASEVMDGFREAFDAFKDDTYNNHVRHSDELYDRAFADAIESGLIDPALIRPLINSTSTPIEDLKKGYALFASLDESKADSMKNETDDFINLLKDS